MATKILVVDDEPQILKLLGIALERIGYEVALARDGEQALEEVAKSVPDLVLCDIRMPKMDGYELLIRLRSEPRSQDVAIVMLTAVGQPETIRRAMGLGASGYIVKPFIFKELRDEIERLLAAPAAPISS